MTIIKKQKNKKTNFNNKKNQGEIFGIALMFVVIIIGVIVYGQIKMINNTDEIDLYQEGKYKIVGEEALNTILKMSVGCTVERGKNTLKDLINFCLENEYAGTDPTIKCDNGEHSACQYVIELLNTTINKTFNSNLGIGKIPYELKVDIPERQKAILANQSFTNFGEFELKTITITKDNYRKYGYKRAPSGLISWATAQRNIEFELYLYYR